MFRPKFNPLSFPVGRRPGVNPNHPATSGLSISSIAQGATFLQLHKPSLKPSFTGVGVTAGMDGVIGPIGTIGAFGSVCYTGANGTGTVFHTGTFAMILRPKGSLNTLGLWCDTNNGTPYDVINLNSSGQIVFSKNETTSPTVITATTVKLALNNPYFIAVSWVDTVAVNFIAIRLDTGQIQQQTVANTVAITGTAADVSWCCNPTGGSGTLPVAAAMFNYQQCLSPAQLLAWAQDPWDFWYPNDFPWPRPDLPLVGASAPAGDSFALPGVSMYMM